MNSKGLKIIPIQGREGRQTDHRHALTQPKNTKKYEGQISLPLHPKRAFFLSTKPFFLWYISQPTLSEEPTLTPTPSPTPPPPSRKGEGVHTMQYALSQIFH